MKNISLILGFFDGVHAGHREVIKTAVNYAKSQNLQTVLLRPDMSPAEFFGRDFEYILSKRRNYELLNQCGVNDIISISLQNFAKITAEEFLKYIIEKYQPKSITTGFNHTFGAGRGGTPKLLSENQEKYGYKYFCVAPFIIDNNPVSSTVIRNYLIDDKLEYANYLLKSNFYIEGTVEHGNNLGQKLGFPTANITYPQKTVKLPYGVYKVIANNKTAVLNWGFRPTIGGNKEVLEVHIPNYHGNLYNLPLKIEFIKKIRNEKKFSDITELKSQIEKDIQECLKS